MITRDIVSTNYEYLPRTKEERSWASVTLNAFSEGDVREQLVSNILERIYGDIIASIESADSLESLAPLVAKLKDLIGDGDGTNSVPLTMAIEPKPVVVTELTPVQEPDLVPEPVIELAQEPTNPPAELVTDPVSIAHITEPTVAPVVVESTTPDELTVVPAIYHLPAVDSDQQE